MRSFRFHAEKRNSTSKEKPAKRSPWTTGKTGPRAKALNPHSASRTGKFRIARTRLLYTTLARSHERLGEERIGPGRGEAPATAAPLRRAASNLSMSPGRPGKSASVTNTD